MAFSKYHFPWLPLFLLITTSTFFFFPKCSSNSTTKSHILEIQSMCKTTPYKDLCFNTLKLSITIDIAPNLLNFLLHSLGSAIDEANKLSSILETIKPSNLIEKQRGAIQDCKDLHKISMITLQKSLSKIKSSKVNDARVFLSGALTNKATCLEGLASATGPRKQTLVNSIIDTYKHVSNSLSMLSNPSPNAGSTPEPHGGKTPSWVDPTGLLKDEEEEDEDEGESETMVVAEDGSGNFTRVQDAIDFAPNNSEYRTFIYVRKGVYEENVEIPNYKPNIVLLGDGSDVTFIIGSRSVGDGWTTFRSATLAVSGDGFLARDITFENNSGPKKHQAVALRINADLVAIYRCTILGYQDTLYVHSFRQFYRECDIYGTVDYIFGNAAVVFQGCNIVSRMPMPGQYTVITAQSRDIPEENTGISIQNCTILATDDLYSNRTTVKSFLGRPWRKFARTIFMESYIDDFIHPLGWISWTNSEDSDNNGLDTLYYGEYGNHGPGSDTGSRVTWPGYHVMGYDEASNFSVSQFIVGDEWLDSTSFPYDEGIEN